MLAFERGSWAMLVLAPSVTASPDTDTLSLHDALPIYFKSVSAASARRRASPPRPAESSRPFARSAADEAERAKGLLEDRKSTRLNSSHVRISYAVFCLKKKIKNATITR